MLARGSGGYGEEEEAAAFLQMSWLPSTSCLARSLVLSLVLRCRSELCTSNICPMIRQERGGRRETKLGLGPQKTRLEVTYFEVLAEDEHCAQIIEISISSLLCKRM